MTELHSPRAPPSQLLFTGSSLKFKNIHLPTPKIHKYSNSDIQFRFQTFICKPVLRMLIPQSKMLSSIGITSVKNQEILIQAHINQGIFIYSSSSISPQTYRNPKIICIIAYIIFLCLPIDSLPFSQKEFFFLSLAFLKITLREQLRSCSPASVNSLVQINS